MKGWRRLDFLLAGGVGLLIFAAYSLFPLASFTPELSRLVAAARGIMPPTSVYGALYMRLIAPLPPDPRLFGLIGHAAAALAAALFTLTLVGGVRMLTRANVKVSGWSERALPWLCAAIATLAFTGEIAWNMFTLFSPPALETLAALTLAFLFERWVFRGGYLAFCFGLCLLGLMITASPVFIFLAVAFAVWYLALRQAVKARHLALRIDFPRLARLPFWRMFFSFAAGLGLGAFLLADFTRATGLSELLGWRHQYFLIHLAADYVRWFRLLATPGGWILGVGLCLAPALIMLRCFPSATDSARPLTFLYGVAFLVCGAVGYLVQGPFAIFRFWTWLESRDGLSCSPSFLLAGTLLGAIAAAIAAAAVLLDGYARESRWRRGAVFAFTLAALLPAAKNFPHAHLRRVMDFNAAAVQEIVREASGATWLFTDGAMDAAIELEAACQGARLYTMDVLSTDGLRGQRLRQRALVDAAEFRAAAAGAAALLRERAGATNGLDRSALQLGLEIFRREPTLARPRVSAFVARTAGFTAEDERRGGEIAADFAARLLSLEDDVSAAEVPRSVRRAFDALSWRLSRLARWRGDHALADRLDARNGSLSAMLKAINEERLRLFMQLTPDEGLALALDRADFDAAVRYAAAVLKARPLDAEAHFATAMHYLMAGDDARAEEHFLVVLAQAGEEPASLNNLSILARRAGKTREAVDYARRAQTVLPDNPEIARTLEAALSAANDR